MPVRVFVFLSDLKNLFYYTESKANIKKKKKVSDQPAGETTDRHSAKLQKQTVENISLLPKSLTTCACCLLFSVTQGKLCLPVSLSAQL